MSENRKKSNSTKETDKNQAQPGINKKSYFKK